METQTRQVQKGVGKNESLLLRTVKWHATQFYFDVAHVNQGVGFVGKPGGGSGKSQVGTFCVLQLRFTSRFYTRTPCIWLNLYL